MTKWKKECNDFVDAHVVGMDVLDIGCGKYPHPKATKTLDIGSEFSPDIIADINEDIPLPDRSYDCIILNNVLEHIYNPQRAIAECHRILKADGRLLVTVPFLIKLHQEPQDFHRYTKYMLEILFKDFEHVVTQSEDSFTNFVKDVQVDLFGMIGRKCLIGFIATKIITSVSSLLPDVYDERYPRGYFIIAKKRSSK